MKRKIYIRFLTVCISLLVLLVFSAGCGTVTDSKGSTPAEPTETDSKATAADTDSGAPVPIRWVRTGNEQDPKKDRILLELQRRMNIELEIVSIPWDQYPNKLNIMMASGEQLDMANCDPGKTLIEWARNDIILSYDEYLKDGKYPYVSSVVNSEAYKGLKIDGKVYFKPLGLCPQQWGYLIRQDWLDNLGLDIPTNIDEFYEVIRAFTYDDPDKNNKQDTYGLYVRAGGDADPTELQTFSYILRAYAINAGAGNWVELPDGTVTRYEVSDAAKEGARFIAKAIKEGLINKDWISLKRDSAQGPESDDFAAGKYGIAPTSIPDVFNQKIMSVNSDAKLAFLPPLNGENDVPPNSGNNGGYWWGNIIPKTCRNPEKVIELLDYSLTAEGRELTEYGIQGIHFTDYSDDGSGGRIYRINKAECDKDWDTQKNGYLYPLAWGGFNYYEYAYIPITEHNFDYDEAFKNVKAWQPEDMAKGQFANWQIMNTSYSIPSPLMNVFDDNLLGDEQKLLSIFAEGWLKSVVDIDNFDRQWDEMTEKWMNAGGKEIIEYGNKYYKENK
ncbi:MAG TPA: extracellular solute-binding protein [Clostridia bacterium]